MLVLEAQEITILEERTSLLTRNRGPIAHNRGVDFVEMDFKSSFNALQAVHKDSA